MSGDNTRLPILLKGENLVTPTDKPSGGSPKALPRTYEESKTILLSNISDVEKSIINTAKEYIAEEFVICTRMAKGFMAKSYSPEVMQKTGEMELVGARAYRIEENTNDVSKLYFYRTTMSGLRSWANVLKNDNFKDIKTLNEQIRSINKIDLLKAEEKIMGFDSVWNKGQVEIVLHPFNKSHNEVIDKAKKIIGNSIIKVKEYEDGPIFISALIDKNSLRDITNFNALRAVQPMRTINIPEIRGGREIKSPKPPVSNSRSIIKIGMFDGGVDDTIPLLEKYVTKYDPIITKADEKGIAHGSAVCGAILYGPLNNFDKDSLLHVPEICVESFRVLPLSDSTDIELYEVIDIIEDIVPKRRDIKIYNISLGPAGPILDDQICRFTYALDRLAYDNGVIFCVAVGNDGDLETPLNRIQAPSDMVNGIGIGAYTYNELNTKIHAYYSCIGEGREGCKVKPDVVAFGGCEKRPFQAVSITHNNLCLVSGTSFSSPVAAGMIGRLLVASADITPLMARSLLIHTAKHPNVINDRKLGYGFIKEDPNDILQCTQQSVTIFYNGSIEPKKYSKLPIAIPDLQDYNGNIDFLWTITTLTDPNGLDSDGYTNTGIEDTFHPSADIYNMNNKNLKPKKITVNITKELEKIEELKERGYKLSEFQKSKSPKSHKTEEERRLEFKWDTVTKKTIACRGSSLKEPCLVLHALDRYGTAEKPLIYSVAITVTASNYPGGLYDGIINKYRVLQPVTLRNINEIMVTI